MPDRININNAPAKELTPLPGIAKNVAYNIANHRKRHGYFTHWEELLEVKEFPRQALPKIKARAALFPVEGLRDVGLGPRRIYEGDSRNPQRRSI
ncbi:MAG: hypothetical protein DMG98_13550 [Acidobacteria bacterium]|nr:MAG: hypothetical protein DMG98_13550 [Acidobacteriota bacterium]